jgi:8-oxo-dGTP diphosphatase
MKKTAKHKGRRRTWSINPVTRVKPSGKVYQRGKIKETQNTEENEWRNFHPIYRYCPACTSELVEKKADGKIRKCCPVCGFVLYRNPAPASGVIIEKDGKVLLVKRKYSPFKGDWSLPAGFMEYGESPEACAIRETYEETNLKIRLSGLFGVYSDHDDPRTYAILVVYLADIIEGEPKPGDDAQEISFFKQEEIPSNIAFAAQRQVLKDYFKSRARP